MQILSTEAMVRLGFFAGVLAVMVLWEALAPRRQPTVRTRLRWLNNLGLGCLNTLALRFVVPLGAMGVALFARERGWGLFNNVPIPDWLAVIFSVIILDLALYLQHVLFHAVPFLWRFHRVHHADLDIDASTGLRFHTLEILLSMGIKAAVVIMLGAPALAVLAFEILLNATSIFSHGNARLPLRLDRVLRLFLVTPDMHRVHHSVIVRETNSNFGFNLPWWDYLFGTYRQQPAAGHSSMTIGLPQFQDERVGRLPWMLVLPFIQSIGGRHLAKRNAPATPEKRSPGKVDASIGIEDAEQVESAI